MVHVGPQRYRKKEFDEGINHLEDLDENYRNI